MRSFQRCGQMQEKQIHWWILDDAIAFGFRAAGMKCWRKNLRIFLSSSNFPAFFSCSVCENTAFAGSLLEISLKGCFLTGSCCCDPRVDHSSQERRGGIRLRAAQELQDPTKIRAMAQCSLWKTLVLLTQTHPSVSSLNETCPFKK